MPLVIPGLQSKEGSSTEEWQSQLVGKKIGDESNEIVRTDSIYPSFLFYTREHGGRGF